MTHRWLLLFAALAITSTIFGRASAEEALVKRVKTTWRAQDGSTIDDILSHVGNVAHFIPRGWEVGQKKVTLKTPASFRGPGQSDEADDEYTITWDISASGVISLGPAYAKTMELGWRPFALSLIAREVADEYPQPKDDLWRLQLSVDCKITGPSYFTRGGIIIFTKKNHEAWQPASFFARRISKYPGHWFDQEDPDEQRTFDAVRKALKRTR